MNTRFGYKVTGIILLCDSQGATWLDCSKDIYVHVSTCTSYDFDIFMPVVWKLWRW